MTLLTPRAFSSAVGGRVFVTLYPTDHIGRVSRTASHAALDIVHILVVGDFTPEPTVALEQSSLTDWVFVAQDHRMSEARHHGRFVDQGTGENQIALPVRVA